MWMCLPVVVHWREGRLTQKIHGAACPPLLPHVFSQNM